MMMMMMMVMETAKLRFCVFFWFIVSFLHYVCFYLRVNKDEYKTRKVAHFSANRTRDESLYSCRLAGPTNAVAATVVQLLRRTSAGPFVISLFLFVKIDLATDSGSEYDRDKKKIGFHFFLHV